MTLSKTDHNLGGRWPSGKPKVKASIIICPDCNYRCVEYREPLAELFLRHLKKVHAVTPRAEFVENLKGKITYLRYNDRISYIDPFVHVQWEDLLT